MMDRDVLYNGADLVFETCNGTNNHIWIRCNEKKMWVGSDRGDSKLLYRYYEDADELISWICLYSQSSIENSPTYRCVKGNEFLSKLLSSLDIDDIYYRVLALDEETANKMIC
jgi:hypothetical protein